MRQRQPIGSEQSISEVSRDTYFAEAVANDLLIGFGTDERPGLKANVWQYFDRLSKKERIRELTHSFRISGVIDGVGWASIYIKLDEEYSRFRISYIGSSPADFRRFAAEVGDGEEDYFIWSDEPRGYHWKIQRRGGILYVSVPEIRKMFFNITGALPGGSQRTDCRMAVLRNSVNVACLKEVGASLDGI